MGSPRISVTTMIDRLSLAVLAGCALAVGVSWVTLLAGLDSSFGVEFGDEWVARDLRAFTLAARFLLDGRGADIYDPALFDALGGTAYLNPPFFAIPFIALTWLSSWLGWVAWTVISVVVVIVALQLIRTPRPVVIGAAMILTYPLFVDLQLGQNAAVSLLLLAMSYRFLAIERGVEGGVAAGLLSYKPWLAAGTYLWWLVDWRRRRVSLLTALATIAIVVAASWIAMPAAWEGYLDRISEAVRDSAASPIFEFTVWHSVRQLAPSAPTMAVTTAAGVVWVSLLLAYVHFVRSARHNLDACFAGSVVASLLLAPHLLAYDWVLLIIPYVLLFRSFSRLRGTLLLTGSTLASISIASWPLGTLMWSELGRSVPLAFTALCVCAIVVGCQILRELRERSGDPVPAGAVV